MRHADAVVGRDPRDPDGGLGLDADSFTLVADHTELTGLVHPPREPLPVDEVGPDGLG